MPTVICESMMMGVATNVVAVRPTVPSISKQQWSIVIQLIASSTLIFFYHMLFVQVSVGMA